MDQIVIVDTGSTDGTIEKLREDYGITPIFDTLEDKPCQCKSMARNSAFLQLKTDWILTLDADECLNEKALKRFIQTEHKTEISGYFGRWTNHIEDLPSFEDYKLFVFRNGLIMRGLVHDNIQVGMREHHLKAQWSEDLIVDHFPEMGKLEDKALTYKKRLHCALEQDSGWLRYHWFLGYMLYQEGDWNQAIKHLKRAFTADSKLFPVESLNSGMVLTELYARMGSYHSAEQTLKLAIALYNEFEDDFEVIINTRMKPWMDDALVQLKQGQIECLKSYRFAR